MALEDQFPTNSHKSKEKKSPIEPKPTQRVEKVVNSEPIRRKAPLGRSISETFTGDDARTVGTFVLFDVIIPSVKSMISEVVGQGVNRMLFGDSHRSRSYSGRSNYTSYNKLSTRHAFSRDEGPRREMSYKAKANHEFDEIVLESRGEAEEVLERLGDLINEYDVARVSDLYALVGIMGSYADDKWGWADLRGASVARVREGYLLDLPRTQPID